MLINISVENIRKWQMLQGRVICTRDWSPLHVSSAQREVAHCAIHATHANRRARGPLGEHLHLVVCHTRGSGSLSVLASVLASGRIGGRISLLSGCVSLRAFVEVSELRDGLTENDSCGGCKIVEFELARGLH